MVQDSAMIRRTVNLGLILLLAACAQAPKSALAPSHAPAAILPPPVQPPPEVPIPPAPPRGEPSGYLGLPQANLRAQLGTPQFMRRDGGTQMWRYDGAQCRAFFFLYGPQGAETVRHVETVPAGAASAADPLCLSALKSARKPS
jgi:hypothetical protein